MSRVENPATLLDGWARQRRPICSVSWKQKRVSQAPTFVLLSFDRSLVAKFSKRHFRQVGCRQSSACLIRN